MKSLSRVRLFTTPWTAAYQAPPSMGFSRQKYWSGVPLPSPHLEPSKLLSGLHYQRNHKPKACSNPKVLIFHCCCSVAKSCTALCNYVDYSTAGSPVHHYLPELAQTQSSSVSQLCPTLCDPMDCSTPGFPVHHQLLELAQLMSIQRSHPLSSPSPPAFNLFQHQGLFQ